MLDGIEVKRVAKKNNEFVVKGRMTAGKVLCLMHALEQYQSQSPLAEELLFAFRQATINPNGVGSILNIL
jgi:hypothetical protein